MINQLIPLFLLIIFPRCTFSSHLALPLWPDGSSAEGPELILRFTPGRSDPLLGQGYALYVDRIPLPGNGKAPLGDYDLLLKKKGGRLAELQINYGSTPCRIFRFTYEKEGCAGKERLASLIIYDGQNHRLYAVSLPARFRCRSGG